MNAHKAGKKNIKGLTTAAMLGGHMIRGGYIRKESKVMGKKKGSRGIEKLEKKNR